MPPAEVFRSIHNWWGYRVRHLLQKMAFPAILFGLAGAAQGADLGIYPGQGTVATTAVEFGSGWYLRGDISYTAMSNTRRTYYTDDRYEFDDNELSHPFGYSIGAGYVFNNWLRADLTLDQYTMQDWRGTSQPWDCNTGDCYGDSSAEIKRNSVMLNGYVSLGQWAGITPYVGGGIGVSDVAWEDYSTAYYCVVDPGETCDYGAHSGATTGRERYDGPTQEGRSASALVPTFAVTTGFDYRVSKNLLVDLGYKWTAMGGGVVIEKNSNGPGSPVRDGEFDFLHTHEFKVGLRYEVW